MKKVLLAVFLILALVFPANATMTISAGSKTSLAGVATDVHPFRLASGWICLKGDAGTSAWSQSPYTSWARSAPPGTAAEGPGCGGSSSGLDGFQAAYYVGEDEIMALESFAQGTAPGPYTLGIRRSTNSWSSYTNGNASIVNTNFVPFIGDAGDTQPGPIFHHGFVWLPNGNLMATFYGNYAGDHELFSGYPTNFGARKSRLIAMYSSDKGATWGSAVTMATNLQLGRGTGGSVDPSDVIPVPVITQEGFIEAGVTRTADGTFFAVARTGSRIAPNTGPVQPTALFGMRSSDGLTWTTPAAITADRTFTDSFSRSVTIDDTWNFIGSSSAYPITLGNGVVVLAYARPGGGLVFSENNGLPGTWKQQYTLTATSSDVDHVQIGFNQVLVFYQDSTLGNAIVAQPFTIDIVGQENNAYIQLKTLGPYAIASGRNTRLQWFTQNATGCTLSGGIYSSTAVGANANAGTGTLTVDTAYTLACVSTIDASPVSAKITIDVL